METAIRLSAASATLRTSPSALGANGLPTAIVDAVESTLEVNAALFEDGEGRIVLVSLDLLFAGADISRRVHETVQRCDPSASVWLAASHTHRAPAVDRGKSALGVVNESTVRGISDQVCSLIEGLLTSGNPGIIVRPKFGHADMSGLSVHRRGRGRLRLTKSGLLRGGIVAAADFDEPVQTRAIRVDWIDEAGNVVLVVWHWACHPTAYPDPRHVSSDYVGVVRECVRREVRNVPVLFFQGFAGDIRPPAIRTLRSNPVRRVLVGAGFRRFSFDEYRSWSREVGRRVVGIQTKDPEMNIGRLGLSSNREELDASQIVRGGNTRTVIVQSVQIGPLGLHGVSAEPSYSHVPRDADQSFDWYCGYLEDVYGYFPTARQYFEGGYEVDGFCAAFGCDSLTLDGIHVLSARLAKRVSCCSNRDNGPH